MLYADATVEHPGVVLTAITRDHGTLIYSTDRYRASWRGVSGESWKHNLRAIALGLEALRAVERHGIADRGQQYAGFREIGSGIPMDAPMTETRALDILGLDPLNADPEMIRIAFKALSLEHHPAHGGDPDTFRLILEARNYLLGS